MDTRLITDFTGPDFRESFRLYFNELGITIRDWDGLFHEMDTDGRGNLAYLGMDDGKTVGFIQFCPMDCAGWFMTKTLGFIREFWMAPAFRRRGYGSLLLERTEAYFLEHGAYRAILTADDAAAFYLAHGYKKAPGIQAKNNMEVFSKTLA